MIGGDGVREIGSKLFCSTRLCGQENISNDDARVIALVFFSRVINYLRC